MARGWQPNSLAIKCHFDGIIVLAIGLGDFLRALGYVCASKWYGKRNILIKSHYYSTYNDENRKQCALFGVFASCSCMCACVSVYDFAKTQNHGIRALINGHSPRTETSLSAAVMSTIMAFAMATLIHVHWRFFDTRRWNDETYAIMWKKKWDMGCLGRPTGRSRVAFQYANEQYGPTGGWEITK